jgi:hypothetical protein
LRVTQNHCMEKVEIAADGDGLVSRSGTALIAELTDRLGLTSALAEAFAETRERAGGHDRGRVLRDLALTLADGGDCLADLGALREQPELFGRVASAPTAWRAVAAAAEEGGLEGMRQARAAARERAWSLGGAPAQIVLDFDSHLLTAHSEKQGATPTWKRGFGFHPLLCYLDGSGEPLAGVLREGRAGANTAADHLEVLALAQIPAEHLDRPMLARSDSAGATHELARALAETDVRFSLGYGLTEAAREAILALDEAAWAPAIDQDGDLREGAWVAELTGAVDLPEWPAGTRLICRRERPHPGAQLSFTDHEGHRFQCLITDQDGGDLATLEARHRAHARAADSIRTARECGLSNLPFREFEPNAVWLELVLMAQDLLAHTATLCLEGELARAEPKRLRHRILHVAGRLTHSGRRLTLHLPRRWPWAQALIAAFGRLRSLPLLA